MEKRDLLVISDLHLGEDLGLEQRRTEHLERELVEFLDHHRQDGASWRLVINGDMLELIGVTLMPSEVGWVAGLHHHDHHYGLGGRALAAALKLQAVVEHHQGVFRALARFVGAGHELSIVIGNHDAELHWPDVQQVFIDAVAELWGAQRSEGDPSPDEIRERIGFHPWFFHEAGVVWIEHGHQYDPYCSFEDVLEPAFDEEEIDPSVGGLLLRYVCGKLEDDLHTAWGRGFWGYLYIWISMGPGRFFSIAMAYIDVCRRLVEHWRSRAPERLAARRARAAARRARLSAKLRIPEERLRQIAALRIPPVVVDLERIVRALMIDRLLLLIVTPVLLGFVLLAVPWAWQLPALGLLLPVLLAAMAWAARAREPVDRRAAMRRTAIRIRELAEVPFVVMGHSHDPCVDPLRGYLNTGTWVPHIDQRKAFTHVRIQRTAAGVRALLCQWRDGASRVFDPEGVPEVVPVHLER